MKKILVTGGAGYIGSHTVVELYQSGYEVIIIDNFINAEKSVLKKLEQICQRPMTLYEGDCNDITFMKSVFEKENIFGVIHFAAYKSVNESVAHPMKYYKNNVSSLIALLEVTEKYGVSNLVFSSSCTVYGQPEELPVTEETPKQPAESPYGNTKQICEEIIDDYVKSDAKLKALALRYFNPIGAHPSSLIGELPRGVPNNLVPYLTQTAAGKRKQLTIFGDDYNTVDGTCVRDFIHVVDLAKAHVKALDFLGTLEEQKYYDVFNIGTGKGNSVMELVKTFEKVNNVPLNYKLGERRPGDIEQIYAEVDKGKSMLNWAASLTLEDALRDAWNWEKTLI